MHEPNVQRVLELIGPNDVVLDIGGWARPFNRANYVIDAEPYETRGYYGATLPAQGGDREHFTRENWIRRDLCDHAPFPFRDKQIDFVVCSHTLEDIRDPIRVCSEMIRVAKRGYLEVPSRLAESCRGIEDGQVGWSHHRWLIDITGRHVTFVMKYHRLHAHWRFSFPASYLHRLAEDQKIQWLVWADSFEFSERTIHGVENIEKELEAFVERIHPYPQWCLRAGAAWQRGRGLLRRAGNKLARRLRL